MAAPKHMDFNERRKAAATAKQALLEKFRAHPGPDDPAVAQRLAERQAIIEAREARAAERKAAREAEARRLAAEAAARAAEQKAREAEAAALLAKQAAEERALEAQRKEGKSPADAIFEACMLRFRPILMTTMAAMLGALPLALESGVGYELRRPLGISIVGGLLLSQLLTLYTTPVVYLAFDRLRLCLRGKRGGGLHQGAGHQGA